MINSDSLLKYVDSASFNDLYPEEHNRTLASRTYYAVFYKCNELAQKYSIELDSGLKVGIHARLYISMKNWSKTEQNKIISQKIWKIAGEAERLKRIRENADYRIWKFFPPNDVKVSRMAANKILEEINSLLN